MSLLISIILEQVCYCIISVPYLCRAVPGGGRGECPAVLSEETLPGRGQPRVQSRSLHGCMLPMLSEIPTDHRAAGIHSHCPNWRERDHIGSVFTLLLPVSPVTTCAHILSSWSAHHFSFPKTKDQRYFKSKNILRTFFAWPLLAFDIRWLLCYCYSKAVGSYCDGEHGGHCSSDYWYVTVTGRRQTIFEKILKAVRQKPQESVGNLLPCLDRQHTHTDRQTDRCIINPMSEIITMQKTRLQCKDDTY